MVQHVNVPNTQPIKADKMPRLSFVTPEKLTTKPHQGIDNTDAVVFQVPHSNGEERGEATRRSLVARVVFLHHYVVNGPWAIKHGCLVGWVVF
jgi:hypothetical protein